MTDLTEKTLATERKYTGKIISVDLLDIELPDGRKAKREVIKDAHTARKSEADRRLPKGERGRQIAAVRTLVREARAAGKRMSILRACRKVWQKARGGYPSSESLYHYCHNHEQEF